MLSPVDVAVNLVLALGIWGELIDDEKTVFTQLSDSPAALQLPLTHHIRRLGEYRLPVVTKKHNHANKFVLHVRLLESFMVFPNKEVLIRKLLPWQYHAVIIY